MVDILITSGPIHGHVAPLLSVAEDLVGRGHSVRFLTGSRFAEDVAATGATHLSLPGAADFDDRELATGDGDRPRPRRGSIGGIRADMRHVFLEPARAQHDALTAARRSPTDVVLTDPTFTGAILLAAERPADRPPVVGIGMSPPLVVSADTAPYGAGVPPSRRRSFNRLRNRMLHAFVEGVLVRPVQREWDALFREIGRRPAPVSVLDGSSCLDAVVQLSVASFEYPRHDLRVPLHFAGPLPGRRPRTRPDPPWWPELFDRRVVLVTQGTVSNADFEELVLPATRGLSHEDLLVVVTTGGPPVEQLGPLPANVRAATFLDHERLLEHASVFVTNGGYGGVQRALAHGVPVVVAGATEDKPEVAARVAWSGVGIDLRSGRPDAETLAAAVREVLASSEYRDAARRVAAEMAAAPGLDLIAQIVEELVGRRGPAGSLAASVPRPEGSPVRSGPTGWRGSVEPVESS
ncbi:MAG: glycosyltransferase [Phycicoccus sp.]